MNEHTNIDPETGIDRTIADRIARNKAFWAKVDESNKRPRELAWDNIRPAAAITHTNH